MALNAVSFVLIFSSLLLSGSSAESSQPALAKGLSWSFHDSSCPTLESIVRKQAAGLLRLHFHDCFVQGCYGSVLLDGSAGGPSEQSVIPNLTLRKKAYEIMNDLRRRVHKECGRVVSCADITAIAARDSVFLSVGPDYKVPLGRRDGLNFASQQTTLANLPAATSNTTVLLNAFSQKNFDATDLVALSGGHSIGISHCRPFTGRLYPTQDSTLDKTFANDPSSRAPNPTQTTQPISILGPPTRLTTNTTSIS